MEKPPVIASVAKLVIAGERAGLTIEQMIDLLEGGLTVEGLLELIAKRLDAIQPVTSTKRSRWVM